MNVRMTGGLRAGEIVNLPFLAARGAISNGLAEAVEEARPAVIETEAATVVVARQVQPGPVSFGGKRHGRRR